MIYIIMSCTTHQISLPALWSLSPCSFKSDFSGLSSHCVQDYLAGSPKLWVYLCNAWHIDEAFLSLSPYLSLPFSAPSCIGCSQFSFVFLCVICAISSIKLMVCLVCLTFRRTWPRARTKLKHILFSLMIAHKMSPRNPKKGKGKTENWSREKRT